VLTKGGVALCGGGIVLIESGVALFTGALMLMRHGVALCGGDGVPYEGCGLVMKEKFTAP
jgi:hypothetical protein